MKKTFNRILRAFALALSAALMCGVLAGCGSGYDKAEELYASGNFAEAFEIYEKMGDSEDAVRKAVDCEFFMALEESVLSRMESEGSGDSADLVNTELAYLDRFSNATMSNPELNALCDKYIEGLDLQKDSLDMRYEYENQIEWQRGEVYRLEVLKTLYDEYSFMRGNKEFEGNCVLAYEDQKAILDAYDAIEKDLDSQFGPNVWDYTGGGEVSLTVRNNTDYGYSTVYVVTFEDRNGKILESYEVEIEDIEPHSSYEVKAYYSDDSVYTFDWYNYYTDVKYE